MIFAFALLIVTTPLSAAQGFGQLYPKRSPFLFSLQGFTDGSTLGVSCALFTLDDQWSRPLFYQHVMEQFADFKTMTESKRGTSLVICSMDGTMCSAPSPTATTFMRFLYTSTIFSIQPC